MQLAQSEMESRMSGIDRLRPWVEAETEMDFSGTRSQRLCDAAHKVLSRRKTPANLDGLLADAQQRGIFLEQLTAELTVGESFFFRNEHQIRALREQVLPEVLCDNADKREVRIWSAGCATGEEPYSLAILLDQILGSHHGWHVSILGTDLNPEFLARAREACYRPWSFRHTDIHQNQTYFSPERDTFRLASKVRDTARFSYLNLVKDVYPSPLTGTLGLDLILFRNVAIYLRPEVTKNIIERFHQALRPGGWLLLGETEVSLAPTKGFEARRFEQATFHQKAWTHNPATDRSPTPMPVLADFIMAPSRADGIGKPPASLPPTIPTAPALPDWVPLPKKHRPEPHAAESDVQRMEQLLAAGKFDDAERSIERIINKQQRAKWRFRLAQELLMCASVARARQMLDRCLAEEPLMIEPQLLQASFAEEADDLWSRLRASMERLTVVGQRTNDPAALCERLAASAKQLRGRNTTGEPAEPTLLILAFDKGSQRYGIPVHDVIEVQTLEHFSPVPGTPAFISGVIHWRGDVLSLLDLGKLFGIPESGIADIHALLIVKSGGHRMAVIASEIEEIFAVLGSAVKPVPELPGNVPPEWILGVHDNSRLLLRMDVILRDARLVDWRH